jgi:hypothetical protein
MFLALTVSSGINVAVIVTISINVITIENFLFIHIFPFVFLASKLRLPMESLYLLKTYIKLINFFLVLQQSDSSPDNFKEDGSPTLNKVKCSLWVSNQSKRFCFRGKLAKSII